MCYQNDLLIISDFKLYCQMILGLSQNTGLSYSSDLSQLAHYSNTAYGVSILALKLDDLVEFLNDLIRTKRVTKLTSISRKIASFRRFFEWALVDGLINQNPAERLPLIKDQSRLPYALSRINIEKLIELYATGALEVRNRLIVSLLYDTGLRVSELVSIQIQHLDLKMGCLRVVGKGSKERVVLFSKATLDSIVDYIQNIRFDILREPFSTSYLLVTYRGGRMHRNTILWIVKSMAIRAGVPSYLVSPHKFRHSFATHMLDGGSHLLAVQMLLGHACISSTEIYTRLSVAKLKQIHYLHHPRANF